MTQDLQGLNRCAIGQRKGQLSGDVRALEARHHHLRQLRPGRDLEVNRRRQRAAVNRDKTLGRNRLVRPQGGVAPRVVRVGGRPDGGGIGEDEVARSLRQRGAELSLLDAPAVPNLHLRKIAAPANIRRQRRRGQLRIAQAQDQRARAPFGVGRNGLGRALHRQHQRAGGQGDGASVGAQIGDDHRAGLSGRTDGEVANTGDLVNRQRGARIRGNRRRRRYLEAIGVRDIGRSRSRSKQRATRKLHLMIACPAQIYPAFADFNQAILLYQQLSRIVPSAPPVTAILKPINLQFRRLRSILLAHRDGAVYAVPTQAECAVRGRDRPALQVVGGGLGPMAEEDGRSRCAVARGLRAREVDGAANLRNRGVRGS